MERTDNGKKYALIAAGCYAAMVLFFIMKNAAVFRYGIPIDESFWLFRFFLCLIIPIGLALVLFMENKKALAIVAGANALRICYYSLVAYVYLWWSMFDVLAYAALVAIILLALKKNQLINLIWFFPAALLLAGSLIGWIRYNYFSILSYVWRDMATVVAEFLALLFVGRWLRNSVLFTANEN